MSAGFDTIWRYVKVFKVLLLIIGSMCLEGFFSNFPSWKIGHLLFAILFLVPYVFATKKHWKDKEFSNKFRTLKIKDAVSVACCLLFVFFTSYGEPWYLTLLAIVGPLGAELWYYREHVDWEEVWYGFKSFFESDGSSSGNYSGGSDNDYSGSSYDSFGSSYDSYRESSTTSSNSNSSSYSSPRSMDMYTVNFRYRSGSAIKDECVRLYFDHQPSVPEIRNELRSMGYYSDDLYVYCLRFGGGLSSATESHPDNLLR